MPSHLIFEKAEKLFTGILFKETKKYTTFTYYTSYFKEPWWNWIVPNCSPENLDEYSLNKLLKTEKMLNRQNCFYINQSQQTEYQSYLHSKGYTESDSDFYLGLKLTKKFIVPDAEIQELNDSNIKDQILLADGVFGDDFDSKGYTELFEYNHKKNITDKHFHNLLLYKNGLPVAFGFLIVDKKDNIAYLHNAATHPAHRRKGYFDTLVKYRCNLAFDHGVKNVFAIVQKEGASYNNYLKLGFKEKDTFFTYTKK